MKQDMSKNLCKYGHGCCTAPDTNCPHWQGTFCELDYNDKDDREIRLQKNIVTDTAIM